MDNSYIACIEQSPIVNLTASQIFREYALYTRYSLFLTGRAGTGKTTLLKELLNETEKKVVVVAPTGVAAINAGGVTIHSMFQLPTTGFIPTDDEVDPAMFTNRRSLARTQKIRKERIEVLLELEMLIIDEISMVRADLLDAIDAVLRRIRKNTLPFGGVQLIVIGDLFQLSPVVNSLNFKTLAQYYESQYFFDSWVWKKSNPITIELTKIYRQDDQVFINVLNNIRVGKHEANDLVELNKRCVPTSKDDQIITLSTHNSKANLINSHKLSELKSEVYNLEAEITGKFSSSAFPVGEHIELKKGCQVMFIRNHPDNLYFNGKIGVVTGMFEEEVFVKCGDESPIRVTTVEWKNVKYTIDKETKEVHKEDIGSFTQYPLRLAWAVTIHKSQGLTFKNAILDIADTFAPGQLYVALSRCTSLEGLYLTDPIKNHNIIIDEKIRTYYLKNADSNFSKEHLAKAKAAYEDIKICEYWNFTKLQTYLEMWNDVVEETDLPIYDKVHKLSLKSVTKIEGLQVTGLKFQLQLNALINEFQVDDEVLHTIIHRCNKGVEYFTEEIHQQLIIPLEKHYKEYKLKSKVSRYLPIVSSLISDLWLKMNVLYKMEYRSIPVHPAIPKHKRVILFDPNRKTEKREKGATYKITLELLNDDKGIEEIAKIRSLAIGTIESHMNRLLKDGHINIDQIMDHERREKLLPYFENNKELSISDIKPKIPFLTSFGELRWIKTFLQLEEKEG